MRASTCHRSLLEINETHKEVTLLPSAQFPAACASQTSCPLSSDPVETRTAPPVTVPWPHSNRFKSPSNHLKEHLTRAGHKRDTAVVSAFGLVVILVSTVTIASCHFYRTFPSHQMRVISRWSSIDPVRFCCSLSFKSSTGRPSDLTAFAFTIAFIAVATSSSEGSVSKAFVKGCCGNLFGYCDQECRISRLAASGRIPLISREYVLCLAAVSLPRYGCNVIRPSSRIRPLSRSSLPSSSRMQYDSASFVSSSYTD